MAGSRMPPISGEMPYGSGDTPRFTLRVGEGVDVPPADVLGPLVDPVMRPNPVKGGIELVRPDGYLAMSVADGEWDPVSAYLHRIAG